MSGSTWFLLSQEGPFLIEREIMARPSLDASRIRYHGALAERMRDDAVRAQYLPG